MDSKRLGDTAFLGGVETQVAGNNPQGNEDLSNVESLIGYEAPHSTEVVGVVEDLVGTELPGIVEALVGVEALSSSEELVGIEALSRLEGLPGIEALGSVEASGRAGAPCADEKHWERGAFVVEDVEAPAGVEYLGLAESPAEVVPEDLEVAHHHVVWKGSEFSEAREAALVDLR